jgi:hypothetical protein
MISVGQFDVKSEVIQVTVEETLEYINKKLKHYTPQEIETALKYGRDNDQTQGGHIYAQRLILWLKKYHTEVWLKKNTQAIHNGTFNQPKKQERLATSKNVSDEFIEDQKIKYQNGEPTALIPVYQTLERQGKFKDISNEEKWWTVEKAMSNLLEEEKELNDIFKFRNLKSEIEKVEIGNSKTVSNRIKAECQRLMVIDYFKTKGN